MVYTCFWILLNVGTQNSGRGTEGQGAWDYPESKDKKEWKKNSSQDSRTQFRPGSDEGIGILASLRHLFLTPPHMDTVPIPFLCLMRLWVCACLDFKGIFPLWLSGQAILVLKVNVNRERRAICWPPWSENEAKMVNHHNTQIAPHSLLALECHSQQHKENTLKPEVQVFALSLGLSIYKAWVWWKTLIYNMPF